MPPELSTDESDIYLCNSGIQANQPYIHLLARLLHDWLPPAREAPSAKRTFQRRTKATPPPEDDVTTTPATEEKVQKQRGPSRFKPREGARNDTSAVRRPAAGAGARRSERPPTRNFVRRKPAGANVTTTTTAAPSSVASSAVTRRPFRIASRRRPGVSSTTTTTSTTAAPPTITTTLILESEESLQDIGDTDAIEDPSLEPRTANRPTKTPRRPLVNLKEEPKDQNPSATNEDERKRQSKKYSASFKQNQLDDLLKIKSGEVTTETGTTVEEYNAETALALATHQLITAPLPVITDYEEDTKPTRAKTTQKYRESTEYTNTPTNEEYSTTFRVIPTTQDFIQTTIRDAYNIYDIPSLSTFYADQKTTADFTTNSRRPYTATYDPSTGYDTTKTTEDISTTDTRQPTQDIDAGKVTTFVSTDTYPTAEREAYTNIPTSYTPRILTTTFEVPKQTGSLSRYSTTPFYQTITDQYVPTTREYSDTPERTSAFSTPTTVSKSRGFSSPNVITPGYSGVQRGGAKFVNPNDKPVTPTADSDGYSTSGYRSSSQDPAYFTRDYLLESPVTKTYDEEYQYLSPTTPQTSTPRKVFRKKIQRKISTTLRPTSTTPTYVPEVATRPSRIPYVPDSTSSRITRPSRISYTQEDVTTPNPRASYAPDTTSRSPRPSRVSYVPDVTTPLSSSSYVPEVSETPKPSRVPSKKPFEKIAKVEPNRTYKPVVNYDYYDDSAERVALKYAEGTKVILHGKGSIECRDVGNFPHPSSCKKFISCARLEFGSLLGWEYVCPKGLSFDPVGGICNWSAGLGCDEKDD